MARKTPNMQPQLLITQKSLMGDSGREMAGLVISQMHICYEIR